MFRFSKNKNVFIMVLFILFTLILLFFLLYLIWLNSIIDIIEFKVIIENQHDSLLKDYISIVDLKKDYAKHEKILEKKVKFLNYFLNKDIKKFNWLTWNFIPSYDQITKL